MHCVQFDWACSCSWTVLESASYRSRPLPQHENELFNLKTHTALNRLENVFPEYEISVIQNKSNELV
jgi:hypothetical protein